MEACIKNLQERYKIREEEAQVISKEYFAYKHQVQRRKEAQAAERQRLLDERKALEDQLAQLRTTADTDQAYAVDLYNRKTDDFADRFRKQAQSNENDLKVIKVQYEQLQQRYVDDLRELEQDLSKANEFIKVLEGRRIAEN